MIRTDKGQDMAFSTVASGRFDTGKLVLRLAQAATAFGMIALIPTTASAYIGPGVGAGGIFSLLAIAGVGLLAVVGLVVYPIRLVMARMRRTDQVEVVDLPDASKTGDNG